MGMVFPAISVWNPWATLIADEIKPIEVRSHKRFQSLCGKRIAIHAAATLEEDAIDIAKAFYTGDKDIESYRIIPRSNFGAVLCLATVQEHRELDEDDSPLALYDCSKNRYWGLVLKDVRKLQSPYKISGRQSIWSVDIPNDLLVGETYQTVLL